MRIRQEDDKLVFKSDSFRSVKGLRAARYVCLYEASTAYSLCMLYKCPSVNKMLIYSYVYERIPKRCRNSVRLWGNCYQFSVGWLDYNKLHVVSKSGRYRVEQ